MNGPINEGVSSALARVFSLRSAILKIVEQKALGTRLDTALMIAALSGKVEAVNYLLDKGADLSLKQVWKELTALCFRGW